MFQIDDDIEDLPAFNPAVNSAIQKLDFNMEVVSEVADSFNMVLAVQVKKAELVKKIGPDKRIPDKLGVYPCECMAPTEAEIDEVLEKYWQELVPDDKVLIEDDLKQVLVEAEDVKKRKSATPDPVNDQKIESPRPAPLSQSSSDSDLFRIKVSQTSSKSPSPVTAKLVYSKSDERKKNVSPFTTAKQELIKQAAQQNRPLLSELLDEAPQIYKNKRYLGNHQIGGKIQKTTNNQAVEKIDLDDEVLAIQDDRLKGIDPKFIERIKMDVLAKPCETSWDDIKGLEYAKETMIEAIVYPILRPEFFTGLRRPPKGVLMFGPPGTGKTLIAKCVANNANATFFNVSASTLTSKWIGEGEMMVRALFTYARVMQPSVIFIDEVDCLLSQRSENEHESSRKLKNEFLIFLDGCGTGDSDRMLLIGATNRPQELDEAARRRFTKRLYIPLPEKEARRDMINYYLSKCTNKLSDVEINELAESTAGYSGADLKTVAEEAAMMPFRDLTRKFGLTNIKEEDIPPMELEHFKRALKKQRPSVSSESLKQYLDWDQQFGSGTENY